MSETLEPLILDLVEWVAREPRTYDEVMAAWRTSCPRLPVLEDAFDSGLLRRQRLDGRAPTVIVTAKGRRILAERGRFPAGGDGDTAAARDA